MLFCFVFVFWVGLVCSWYSISHQPKDPWQQSTHEHDSIGTTKWTIFCFLFVTTFELATTLLLAVGDVALWWCGDVLFWFCWWLLWYIVVFKLSLPETSSLWISLQIQCQDKQEDQTEFIRIQNLISDVGNLQGSSSHLNLIEILRLIPYKSKAVMISSSACLSTLSNWRASGRQEGRHIEKIVCCFFS